MDESLWRQKLAQARTDFANDCTIYPGLSCIVVHIEDGEVDWSSRFQNPHETVRFSTAPPSTRHHHFSLFPDSLWQAVTPRDFDIWNEVFHSCRDSTQPAYEHFCRRSRSIGAWLRQMDLLLFRQFPAYSSDGNYWLWAIVAFGNSLKENGSDPRRLEPEYWLNPINEDDAGFPMPLPNTPEDIEECRQVLPPYLSHLSTCLPTKPPKSFFCQISDVFQASLNLVDWLEQSRDLDDDENNSSNGFKEKVIDNECDIPPEYRECGKISGQPLTTDYLSESSEWNIRPDYVSRNYAANGTKKLTKRLAWGKKKVYLYTELAALRRSKTESEKNDKPSEINQRWEEARIRKESEQH